MTKHIWAARAELSVTGFVSHHYEKLSSVKRSLLDAVTFYFFMSYWTFGYCCQVIWMISTCPVGITLDTGSKLNFRECSNLQGMFQDSFWCNWQIQVVPQSLADPSSTSFNNFKRPGRHCYLQRTKLQRIFKPLRIVSGAMGRSKMAQKPPDPSTWHFNSRALWAWG